MCRIRCATLIGVVALHLAVLAALLMESRTRSIALAADPPVQLLFLPPASIAEVRPERFRPKRITGNTGISLAPPALDSHSTSEAPAGSDSDDAGGGVDWKAEARRAVQAFDIRTRLPPSERTLSVSPAEETWWPWARGRGAGRFKTPAGDWIVWITENCYQIATARASAPAATPPHTVCLGKSSAPAAAPGAPPAAPPQQRAATN